MAVKRVVVVGYHGIDLGYAENAVRNAGHESISIWTRARDVLNDLNEFLRKYGSGGIKAVLYAESNDGWKTVYEYFKKSKVPFGVICPDEHSTRTIQEQGVRAFNRESEKRERSLENFLRELSEEVYDFEIDRTERDMY